MNRHNYFAVGLSVIALAIAVVSVSFVALRHGEAVDDRQPHARWEATIFVPVNDSSGAPFSAGVWHNAMAELVTPFGGATVHEPKDGYWNGRTGVMHEPVRPIVVTFDPAEMPKFRAALFAMGKILGQEEMYARLEKCHVEQVLVQPVKTQANRVARWVGAASPHILNP